MYIGGSLFLLAIGAILRYAVTDSVDGINLVTAGTILMVIGGIGLIVSLFQQLLWRDRSAGVIDDRRAQPRDHY